MILSTYSNDPGVKDFIEWIDPKLSNDDEFKHSYTTSNKPIKTFEFNSIYSAFENYEWKSKSFYENQEELNKYSKKINEGIENDDNKKVIQGCKDILVWGGVNKKGNRERINSCKDIAICLKKQKDINLASCNYESFSKIHCNSGFSKIYSTIINNFIIYDSRVSCALCYLIRSYAEEKNLEKIPESLKFAYSVGNGKDKEKDRNPNNDKYTFDKLTNANYFKNNIKASWLLKLIVEKKGSKFNELQEDIRLRALESALFMIGYKINN